MNTTLSATTARYLAGVAAELTDLSAEDRDDVFVDLETHLAELEDNRIEDELGDPSPFAAEFRRSAGLEHRRSGRWTMLAECQDAESYPQDHEILTDSGAVRFQRDSFGRIVPNLYPLDLLRYNDYGVLTEMAPPSLGFPDRGVPEPSATESIAPAGSYNSPSGR